MANYVTVTSDKKKRTAFWMCLIGGLFGLHYFYVGRHGRGWLAFCTLNFFMLGWACDLITISRGRFKDQYGEYLKV